MYNMKKNKRSSLKKYLFVFLIGVIIIISFSYFLFYKNNKKYQILNFEKNELSNISLKYTDNGKYDIELLKTADKKLIYGTIFDSSENGNLFLTKGIYTFNITSNKFNYYKNDEKNRIIDFYINNNILYKVVLENTSSNNYYWKIIHQNLLTNSEEIFITGYIVNIFDYPRLLVYNNNIYAIAVSNEGIDGSSETYSFYQFLTTPNNSVKELFKYNGSILEDIGILNYNISNNKIYSDNLYYTVVDEKHVQYLIKFNLNSSKKSIIKENKSKDKVLYNYVPTDDGIYIQFASIDETEKSIIEYYSNDDISTLETDINTFENQINNTNLLFHNKGNVWILYNIVENKLNPLNTNLKDKNLYPKYLVVDKNTIIVQDFDNNFYIGTLKTH